MKFEKSLMGKSGLDHVLLLLLMAFSGVVADAGTGTLCIEVIESSTRSVSRLTVSDLR